MQLIVGSSADGSVHSYHCSVEPSMVWRLHGRTRGPGESERTRHRVRAARGLGSPSRSEGPRNALLRGFSHPLTDSAGFDVSCRLGLTRAVNLTTEREARRGGQRSQHKDQLHHRHPINRVDARVALPADNWTYETRVQSHEGNRADYPASLRLMRRETVLKGGSLSPDCWPRRAAAGPVVERRRLPLALGARRWRLFLPI